MIALGHVARRLTAYAILALVAAAFAGCGPGVGLVHHGGTQEQRDLAARAVKAHEADWFEHEGQERPIYVLHVWHELDQVTRGGITATAVATGPRIDHAGVPGLPYLQHEWQHVLGSEHPVGGTTPRFAELDARGWAVAWEVLGE